MEYLALSILGDHNDALVQELANTIKNCECNIVECRISNIGSEFNANLLVSGNWNGIAKLESQLATIEQDHHLNLIQKRTKPKKYPQDHIPYIIYLVAKDDSGLINNISKFFADNNTGIDSIFTETYQARNTGSQMCSITMWASIPATTQIADFRERFMIFCDRFNIDGVMEPDKGN